MIRSFLILLISLLLPLHIFLQSAQATEVSPDISESLASRYDEAKYYYSELHNNQNLAGSRENWLRGTRNFRRIYLSSPTSEFAPSCLFMLGRLYEDMYDRLRMGIDM